MGIVLIDDITLISLYLEKKASHRIRYCDNPVLFYLIQKKIHHNASSRLLFSEILLFSWFNHFDCNALKIATDTEYRYDDGSLQKKVHR